MSGPWISPNYVEEPISVQDVKITAIAFGFTLGFGYLTCSKALKQTMTIWKRSRKLTTYIVLVWLEVLSNLVYGVMAFLMMNGVFKMNVYALIVIVIAWAIEIQCLLQIIINRCSLLIMNKRKAMALKWGVFTLIGLIVLSVFCIWIPARLQVSETYIRINTVWDRTEKCIYLAIDLALNCYFLHLVRSKLISAGMTKYEKLFKFNAFIVALSLSMDILIVAMMSLKNTWVYTQFHPLAYTVKLNIELSMASLITKVARQPGGIYGSSGHGTHSNGAKGGQGQHIGDQLHSANFLTTSMIGNEYSRNPRYHAWVGGPQAQADARLQQQQQQSQRSRVRHPHDIEELSDSDESFQPETPPNEGVITKTTECVVVTEDIEMNETPSISESMRDLNSDFPMGTRPDDKV